MRMLAHVVAEPGKVLRHRAGVLGESRAAEGEQQNAGEQDTHVATLPFEEAHRLGFSKGPRRLGPTPLYRRAEKASVKRLTMPSFGRTQAGLLPMERGPLGRHISRCADP